jgi:hypothetical protein
MSSRETIDAMTEARSVLGIMVRNLPEDKDQAAAEAGLMSTITKLSVAVHREELIVKAREPMTATEVNARNEPLKLLIDKERKKLPTYTGIYVRAMDEDGQVMTCEIEELDKESLISWIRSRGPVSNWAVETLLVVMGYER